VEGDGEEGAGDLEEREGGREGGREGLGRDWWIVDGKEWRERGREGGREGRRG